MVSHYTTSRFTAHCNLFPSMDSRMLYLLFYVAGEICREKYLANPQTYLVSMVKKGRWSRSYFYCNWFPDSRLNLHLFCPRWRRDLEKRIRAPLKHSQSRWAKCWSHQCLQDQSPFPMETQNLLSLPCRGQWSPK